ncbi:MAG: beta strand repeat-containing protein [Nitrospirota bacterium]
MLTMAGLTTAFPPLSGSAFAQSTMEIRYFTTEPFLVGAGLECVTCLQVRLLNGAVAPAGGLGVTLTSNDPTRLLVAGATVPSTGGTASTVVTIAAGASTTTFSLQGLEGVTGLTTVTATATGFTPATSRPISVVTPGYTIVALTSPQAGGGADNVFRVRIGPIRPDGIVSPQPVRRGAPGAISVTVTSSDPSAGQVVTNAGAGASAAASITTTYYETRTTVAAGGMAFRPMETGGSTTVTALIAGFTAATGASQVVSVTPAPPRLSVNLGTVTRIGAGLEVAACCSVIANQPAPAGGVAVTLTSSDATRLLVAPGTIPGSGGGSSVVVTIPEGGTSAAFSLQGVESAVGSASVTATATGHTAGTSPAVSVEAPVLTLVDLSANLAAAAPDDEFRVRLGITTSSGGTTFGTAQALRQGGPGGLTATVTTSTPAAGTLVTSGGSGASQLVQIQPGQSDSSATVATGGVAFNPADGVANEITTITASAPGVGSTTGASQLVSVTSPTLSVNLGTLTRLGAGLEVSACCTVTSNQPAPAGGLVVTLTSTDVTRLRVAEAVIPAGGGSGTLMVVIQAGSTSTAFSLQGVEGASGPVQVVASAAGYLDGTSPAVSIEPPVLTLINLASTLSPGAANDEFGVRVGLPSSAGGTTFGTAQALRQGGPGTLTVTVMSSEPAAGTLVTTTGSGLSKEVSIAPGQSESAASVATGGIAFDPDNTATGQTTTVTASAVGVGSTTGASQFVTVGTALAMEIRYFTTEPFLVGSGLECGSCLQVRLLNGAVAPAGGLGVTLTSNDPTRLLVAGATVPSTGGTASTVVTIAAGASTTTFSLQGLEGVTGLTTVTATATGFTPATSRPISVVTPGYTIVALTSPQAGGGADNVFRVRIGPIRPDGIVSPQPVRRGAPGAISVTVTSSDPSAGQVVTNAGAGASAAASITTTYYETRTTVAAGGMAFRPMETGGSTTVTALIAGFTAATGASQVVSVTPAPPRLSVNLGTVTRIGAGLEVAACCSVIANQPAPAGGVAVTLTSSDATRLLVAPGTIPGSGGGSSVVVTIPEGGTSAAFSLQGVESAVGSASVTATATGHTAGTSPAVSVEAPVLTLVDLSANLAAAAPDDEFRVRLGITTSSGGTTFGTAQALRQGGPGGLTATVTTSTPAAGTLVTSGGSGASQLVQIQPGQSDSSATVATGGVAFNPADGVANEITTITASAPGVGSTTGASQLVSVTSPTLSVNLGTLTRLGAGLEVSACCTVTSNQPAPAGGLVVTLTSTDVTRLRVAEAVIPAGGGSGTLMVVIQAGSTSTAFSLQGVEGASGPVQVVASAAGYLDGTSPAVSIEPPVLTLINLASTLSPGAANDEFGVRVGLPSSAGGTTFGTAQALRQGGPGTLTVTVMSSEPAAGTLVTTTGSGLSKEVSIAPGQSESAASVATGGIAFDPDNTATGQTTTVTASAVGVGSTTGASQFVTVGTALAMEIVHFGFGGGDFRLGAGLECAGCFLIRLLNGATAPTGGLPVTVTSNLPTLLVAPEAWPRTGSSSITLVIPGGTSSISTFTIQGVEEARGTGQLTISAPGYIPATSGPIHIVQPAVAIRDLTPTHVASGADSFFRVLSGVTAEGGGPLIAAQLVRVGSGLPGVTLNITSSNGAVGQLATRDNRAPSVPLVLTPGHYSTPPAFLDGAELGVAFDPVGAGTTTVSVSASGFISATDATQVVTVNP